MELTAEEKIRRLQSIRDLTDHPGYKYLVEDLRTIERAVLNNLTNAGSHLEVLHAQRVYSVLSRVNNVLEFVPVEAKEKLEEILGEMSPEVEYLRGVRAGVN